MSDQKSGPYPPPAGFYPSAPAQQGAVQYPQAPPNYQQAMQHPQMPTGIQNGPQPSQIPGQMYPGSVAPPYYAQAPPAPYPAAYGAAPTQQIQLGKGAPAPYPTMAPVHQPTVIAPVTQGEFDAGARFDGISQRRIPPPPPGVAPNAAQLGAMAPSQVQQKKGGFFSGSGSGGYTFW